MLQPCNSVPPFLESAHRLGKLSMPKILADSNPSKLTNTTYTATYALDIQRPGSYHHRSRGQSSVSVTTHPDLCAPISEAGRDGM